MQKHSQINWLNRIEITILSWFYERITSWLWKKIKKHKFLIWVNGTANFVSIKDKLVYNVSCTCTTPHQRGKRKILKLILLFKETLYMRLTLKLFTSRHRFSLWNWMRQNSNSAQAAFVKYVTQEGESRFVFIQFFYPFIHFFFPFIHFFFD